MTPRDCLRITPLIASLGVRNPIGGWEDLFRIRNSFQILVHESQPELGSDYGNKPRRSFHEETVCSHCFGNRADPERVHRHVRQHVHQHASPSLSRNADRQASLLRRRSGARASGRTGLRSSIGQHASQCFICDVDQTRSLLWRRSGARASGRTGLRSSIGQHASQCLICDVDQTRSLLWRRSGARASGRTGLRSSKSSNCNRRALRLVGRLPVRRGGQ
jgi:hypothetical protein